MDRAGLSRCSATNHFALFFFRLEGKSRGEWERRIVEKPNVVDTQGARNRGRETP